MCIRDSLGVITADNQDVAFALTNLTNDVLMMDIGGSARHIEQEHWTKTDTSFWSGQHRNDGRINKSNILWPFKPNICDQHHSHDSNQVHTLRVRAAQEGNQSQALAPLSLPILDLHVYPQHSTPTARRFASTRWSTQDAVIVVGTPALLSEPMNHTIVRGDALREAADHLQMEPDQLLDMLGVQKDVFDTLPSDVQHEALSAMISLLPAPPLPQSDSPQHDTVTTSAQTGPMEGFGALPAALTAGSQVRKQRMGGTIVEKFGFDQHSELASVALGVKTGVELRALPTEEELGELRGEMGLKIDEILSGRREALLEAVPSIFDPEAQCVVCLNAEREDSPDCVLYQCGHRCVHFDCAAQLRRCPMCRASIAAVLKLSD
eukprot:TRINITY_DN26875_c0_g1_i1.p1 TRINITY_DN26875_c0_g1~~TRINITY_DN26875_c0_g1_i1.p1  ORF type:complete len:378 (-),score=67.71 TRINITY_DN26875_c0_g1_i1:293-1426(-)